MSDSNLEGGGSPGTDLWTEVWGHYFPFLRQVVILVLAESLDTASIPCFHSLLPFPASTAVIESTVQSFQLCLQGMCPVYTCRIQLMTGMSSPTVWIFQHWFAVLAGNVSSLHFQISLYFFHPSIKTRLCVLLVLYPISSSCLVPQNLWGKQLEWYAPKF